jgi:hypothetical protein
MTPNTTTKITPQIASIIQCSQWMSRAICVTGGARLYLLCIAPALPAAASDGTARLSSARG